MEDLTVLTATVTVALAVLGFIGTYVNNVRLSQRQARLDRVNRQLSELYGPLLAIRGASTEAFEHFRQKYWSTRDYTIGNASEEDLAVWRLWMKTVFIPGNRRLYELIQSKADLLLENDMPPVLLVFCAHALGYEVVLRRWEAGDFSDHASVSVFPVAFDDYVKRSFAALKEEQSRLLGRRALKRLVADPERHPPARAVEPREAEARVSQGSTATQRSAEDEPRPT
jgi:hypothetical protein